MKTIFLFTLISLSCFIAEAQKSNIKVWKTITLGTSTKSELIKKLKQKGLNFSTYGDINYFDSIQIEKRQTIKLALVSLDDLGYKPGMYLINYNKVCAFAKKKGLRLCPREVVLQLPLQYFPKAQTIDSIFSIIVGMKQIRVPQYKGSKWYWETLYSYNYGIVDQVPAKFRPFLNTIELVNGENGGSMTDQYDALDGYKFVFVIP